MMLVVSASVMPQSKKEINEALQQLLIENAALKEQISKLQSLPQLIQNLTRSVNEQTEETKKLQISVQQLQDSIKEMKIASSNVQQSNLVVGENNQETAIIQLLQEFFSKGRCEDRMKYVLPDEETEVLMKRFHPNGFQKVEITADDVTFLSDAVIEFSKAIHISLGSKFYKQVIVVNTSDGYKIDFKGTYGYNMTSIDDLIANKDGSSTTLRIKIGYNSRLKVASNTSLKQEGYYYFLCDCNYSGSRLFVKNQSMMSKLNTLFQNNPSGFYPVVQVHYDSTRDIVIIDKVIRNEWTEF